MNHRKIIESIEHSSRSNTLNKISMQVCFCMLSPFSVSSLVFGLSSHRFLMWLCDENKQCIDRFPLLFISKCNNKINQCTFFESISSLHLHFTVKYNRLQFHLCVFCFICALLHTVHSSTNLRVKKVMIRNGKKVIIFRHSM